MQRFVVRTVVVFFLSASLVLPAAALPVNLPTARVSAGLLHWLWGLLPGGWGQTVLLNGGEKGGPVADPHGHATEGGSIYDPNGQATEGGATADPNGSP